MRRLRLPLSCLFLLSATVSSPAQSLLGPYEDDFTQAPPSTWEFFVDVVNGNDLNPPGQVNAPWATITRATTEAMLAANVGRAGTINVAPGTYSAATGEVLPIVMPARGWALEFKPTNPAMPGVAVIAGGGVPAIDVQVMGTAGLPPSVIRGLELTAIFDVLRIGPANPGPLVEEVQVEVRNCTFPKFSGVGDCIEINVQPNTNAFCIIDDNDFVGDLIDEPAFDAGAIRVINANPSTSCSTLMRSNRISFFRRGIWVTGVVPAFTVPRVFSNFVTQCTQNVELTVCNPLVKNNSIVFAMDLSPGMLGGLVFTGGSALTLANNNFWNPDPTVANPTADVVITAPGAVLTVNNNNDQDGLLPLAFPGLGNVSVPPLMVGGDAHPGIIPTDIHLTLPSPLVGAGSFASVASPQSVSVAGRLVRTDVNREVDLDSRVLSAVTPADATVDIGGDEVSDISLSPFIDFANPLLTIDPFGNLRSSMSIGPLRQWNTTVTLSAPAGTAYTLVLGTAFFDTLPGGLENGRVYHNGSTPFGNLMIDTSFASFVVATGVIPGGQSFVNIPVSFGLQLATLQEGEAHLQALVTLPGAGGMRFTERLLIDVKE